MVSNMAIKLLDDARKVCMADVEELGKMISDLCAQRQKAKQQLAQLDEILNAIGV